ncbi:hypothetical protein HHK36_002074 [Tetracentron sinense]|uniref:Gnk2-homologous domain-containing protein n=1 Tax=Tetracentron sinense TaxID=13715 RepID=A0A834ZYE4_TETSI|nr:hypothetical protein HHK36_002074 [Tetracentron sinense]
MMQSLASKTVHLLLFSCLLLLQSPIKAQDLNYGYCNSDFNYTSGSKYASNLNQTLTSLATNASLTGFYTTTVGEIPDQVYGLVQCNGDISKEDCQICAYASAIEITQQCPNKKEAAHFYDNCLVRYSDWSFFSTVTNSPLIHIVNVQGVSNPTLFNPQLGDLLENLLSHAASSTSKFSKGRTKYTDFKYIYGLMQCTRDLQENNCLRCLQEMISYIPSCCDGKQGVRLFSRSCYVRYEINSLFQSSPLPPVLLDRNSTTIPVLLDQNSTTIETTNSTNRNGNYTANDPFDVNLNKLMGSLFYKAPPTGFGISYVGKDPDRVYGLALCRGDVSSTDCKTCVVEASSEIRKRCPDNEGAIIWYDNCLLKYSNEEFFGKIDNRNRFYLYNINNVSDSTSFNAKVKELISGLSNEAYLSPLMFATGELELEESKKLYGLAQCTRDLSGIDCKKCLDGAISELPNCCDGKQGGRVVGGSCNFRYELYPFVNA